MLKVLQVRPNCGKPCWTPVRHRGHTVSGACKTLHFCKAFRFDLAFAASVDMSQQAKQGVISAVKIRTFDQENRWCRIVLATIAVGSDLDAGKIEAYRIDREGLHSHKAYFHHFMDQPTQRLCDVALKMFDRHGHLKPQLYSTFGPETNPGALLYIRGVTLKQKYRRQGIGSAALSQLLQQLNSQYSAKAPWHFAVMHDEDSEATWRPAGFCVIRRSDYLGCCATEGHKCWNRSFKDPPMCSSFMEPALEGLDQQLANAILGRYDEDAEIYTGEPRPAEMNTIMKFIAAGADVNKSMALHHAVAAEQGECIQYLVAAGADVNGQDHKGSTPLHMAAYLGKLKYIELLVSLGARANVKDRMSYTPLDLCTLRMQNLRDIAGIDGTFTAHGDDYMAARKGLQQVCVSQKACPARTIPFYRSKHGCTCKKCRDGYLSPRMKHRLTWTANAAFVMVSDSIDDSISAWPCDLTNNCMINNNLWLFEYVPLRLRRKVTERLAEGWLAVMSIISQMLEANLLPTASAVKAAAQAPGKEPTALCYDPRAARHFLQIGGRVEYALDAILSHSREEHEIIGNGAFSEEEECLAEIAALPGCENDTDYNMVKRLLCNDGHEPEGPYGPLYENRFDADSLEETDSDSTHDDEDKSSDDDDSHGGD